MARKVMIGWFNYVTRVGATLSAGSWQAGLPLNNIKDIDWRFVAESVDANPTNTQFDCDLGADRLVDVIHIGGIMTDALTTDTIQVIAKNAATATVYDSTAIPIWDSTLVEWDTLARSKYFVLPSRLNVRYIEVNFAIAGGVVQVGCIGAYQGFSPATEYGDKAPGWGFGYTDPSDIGRIPGGSPFITKNTIRRRLNFGLPAVSIAVDEIASFQSMLAVNGRSDPYVVCISPDDAMMSIERRSIYGMQSDDPSWRNSLVGHYETTFVIDQI